MLWVPIETSGDNGRQRVLTTVLIECFLIACIDPRRSEYRLPDMSCDQLRVVASAGTHSATEVVCALKSAIDPIS
jgi:hypothetical protein